MPHEPTRYTTGGLCHEAIRLAYDRGARVQIWCVAHKEWETVGDRGGRGVAGEVPSCAAENVYRVHPDDTRHQYGRISWLLLRAADFLTKMGW